MSSLLAVGLLLTGVAACSGDDDDTTAGRSGGGDQAGQGSDEASAGQGAEAADVVDPYDGHTSDVYDGTKNWICHPDLDDDACRDLSATEVDADGSTKPADMTVADDPAVDCFYVYPTVSTDPGLNSDLTPDDPEISTVVAQAAPYAQTCRMFAPAYRQVTLNGLGGGAMGTDAGATAYADVLDAWQTYVSQYNDGRGVVLMGHSQGTGHLSHLIADEIDPNPDLRSRLVSAILLGGTINVPDGEDVGGTFQNIPACREEDQTGCVISFMTFPTDQPPGATSFFGRAGGRGFGGGEPDPNLRALCVDPVELSGGDGVSEAVVPTSATMSANPELTNGIDTAYVVLPDALEARCERTEDFDFFAVRKASSDDVRPLERMTAETLGPNWGLHLVDANVAMGNLLQIVAAEADAFTSLS